MLMKIYQYLQPENIYLDVPLDDKDAVLWFVAEAFASKGVVKDSTLLYEGMKQREETMSTGIGHGIGIPHAASNETSRPALVLVRLLRAVNFDSIDGKPVKIVLALVVPGEKVDTHLQMLAGVARLCQNPDYVNIVNAASDSSALGKQIENLEEATTLL